MLHYVFQFFEYDALLGRFVCALLGILSIPVVYFLGKEIHSKNIGLLSCLLIALNYFHVYYSQDLRFYSLTFLLSALSYLFFIRAFKYSRMTDFIFYALSTSLLLYTHYYGMLIFGIQFLTFIVLIIAYKTSKRFVIGGLISGALAGISFIPWLPVILKDLGTTGYWLTPPKIYFFGKFVYEYFGKDAITSLIFIGCLFLFGLMVYKRRRELPSLPIYVILVMWFVLTYLIPFVKSYIGVPVLMTRYTIVALPALVIIFAIGIMEVEQVKWRKALLAILVVSFIVNIFFMRGYYTKIHKTQFREVSSYVQSRATSETPVLSHLTWYFEYYFKDSSVKVQDVSTLTPDVKQFWLLTAHYAEPKRIELKNQFLDSYEIIEEKKFFEAEAILLRRK